MKKWILWLNLCFISISHADRGQEEYPVVILGSGVAALTSAVYLARSGIPPVVITGPSIGGTITQSQNVQNWPGEFSISGANLSEKMKIQAELNGALLNAESVVSVDFSKRPFLITTKKAFGNEKPLRTYRAHSVIIALGATPKLLNVPGETGPNGYWSSGVYSCAICDGALYKDKIVAVVGGGDSALIEAQYLSNIASKVHILVRKDTFVAKEKQRLKELLASPNIQVHYETNIKEIRGDGSKVTELLIQDGQSNQLKTLPVDALFLAIGALPNTQFFKEQLELDSQGYILLKNHQQTSIDGIYAAGDVSDPEFKQAISAAGDAAKAAIQSQQYLAPKMLSTQEMSPKKIVIKKAIEIQSTEQFNKEVYEANSVIFIDFYSTGCAPCRTFSPLYDSWAQDYSDGIKFLKVNTNDAREIFEQYQIRSIPTLVILDERGQIIRKSIGLESILEIEQRLKMKNKGSFTAEDFK